MWGPLGKAVSQVAHNQVVSRASPEATRGRYGSQKLEGQSGMERATLIAVVVLGGETQPGGCWLGGSQEKKHLLPPSFPLSPPRLPSSLREGSPVRSTPRSASWARAGWKRAGRELEGCLEHAHCIFLLPSS